MYSWQMVLDRTRRFISDVEVAGRSPRITNQEIIDFWVAAQDDLVQYVATIIENVFESFNNCFTASITRVVKGDSLGVARGVDF